MADEAHHLGASGRKAALPEHFNFRLGLSATPQRWFDPEGTASLADYFGDVVYEFGLKEAIATGCLTRYTYHPHLVELTDDEMDAYEELTLKIARLWGKRDSESTPENSLLEALLRQRADLLNRAANKLATLKSLVASEPDMQHALFYCAPKQIDEVIQLLGGELSIPVHTFTAEEDPRIRQELLERFASGVLKGLVAMKCLDEGVDVPATRTAYILASSSNPREFIQRRGRILRLAPGKSHAVVHDLIAVPARATSLRPDIFRVERGIIRRELNRFREFSEVAENKFQATEVVWELAKRYNVMDF